jgi:hypothetical protein
MTEVQESILTGLLGTLDAVFEPINLAWPWTNLQKRVESYRATASYAAAWETAFTALPHAEPTNRNAVKYHLGGCLWPDAMLKKSEQVEKEGGSK